MLDSARSPGDYPRGLRVEGSTDGETWETLLEWPNAEPYQFGGITVATVKPRPLRKVRFTQTGEHEHLPVISCQLSVVSCRLLARCLLFADHRLLTTDYCPLSVP